MCYNAGVMKLEAIRIKNFKALRNVWLRKIPDFSVFLGANGSGKSTFLGVFDFLKEAINTDVHTALRNHGGVKGFDEVRSRNSDGDIHIELKFKTDKKLRSKKMRNSSITYLVRIGKNARGRVVIKQEALKHHQESGHPSFNIMNLKKGVGRVLFQENEIADDGEWDGDGRWSKLVMESDTLAIMPLAKIRPKNFPLAFLVWDSTNRWHFSDIHIRKMRGAQEAKLDTHLSSSGDNLYSVIKRYHEGPSDIMEKIKEVMQRRVPGVVGVETQAIEAGNFLLKIKDKSFQEPFLSDHVSHGTIKMLAYLALLYDPKPHDFLFLEEPENQLYPNLLEELAEEFRAYGHRGGNVFVSTHSPDFLNAAEVDEVFLLIKKDGYTTIVPAAKDKQVKRYMENGDKMGYLWKEGFFRGVDPR